MTYEMTNEEQADFAEQWLDNEVNQEVLKMGDTQLILEEIARDLESYTLAQHNTNDELTHQILHRVKAKVSYCEEPHDTLTIATDTHPEAPRVIHLCKRHYAEICEQMKHYTDELYRAYDRSAERGM